MIMDAAAAVATVAAAATAIAAQERPTRRTILGARLWRRVEGGDRCGDFIIERDWWLLQEQCHHRWWSGDGGNRGEHRRRHVCHVCCAYYKHT